MDTVQVNSYLQFSCNGDCKSSKLVITVDMDTVGQVIFSFGPEPALRDQ